MVLYIYFWLKLDCLDHLGTKIFLFFFLLLSLSLLLLVRRVIITGIGWYTTLNYTILYTSNPTDRIPAEIKTLLVVALIKYHAKKVNIRRTLNKNDKDEESR